MSIDVTVSFAGITITGFCTEPVIVSRVATAGTRVRRYTHWTQVALVFGDEADKVRARKWLKRKSRMLRKKRRGWA